MKIDTRALNFLIWLGVVSAIALGAVGSAALVSICFWFAPVLGWLAVVVLAIGLYWLWREVR